MNYKTIRSGQLFYEQGALHSIEAVATQDCHKSGELDGRDQFRWTARNTQTGEEIDYLVTEGLEHYGPRVSAEPAYVRRNEDGSRTYPILGGVDLDPDDPVRMSRRTPEACAAWAAEINRTGEAVPLDDWFASFGAEPDDAPFEP